MAPVGVIVGRTWIVGHSQEVEGGVSNGSNFPIIDQLPQKDVLWKEQVVVNHAQLQSGLDHALFNPAGIGRSGRQRLFTEHVRSTPDTIGNNRRSISWRHGHQDVIERLVIQETSLFLAIIDESLPSRASTKLHSAATESAIVSGLKLGGDLLRFVSVGTKNTSMSPTGFLIRFRLSVLNRSNELPKSLSVHDRSLPLPSVEKCYSTIRDWPVFRGVPRKAFVGREPGQGLAP